MSVSVANGVRAVVVLVVEDEYLIRCDIADHLRQAGYTVVETASGEEAIAMCKSDVSIDIVFTDRSSRANNDACRLGGTAMLGDGTAATVRSAALRPASYQMTALGHFRPRQRALPRRPLPLRPES